MTDVNEYIDDNSYSSKNFCLVKSPESPTGLLRVLDNMSTRGFKLIGSTVYGTWRQTKYFIFERVQVWDDSKVDAAAKKLAEIDDRLKGVEKSMAEVEIQAADLEMSIEEQEQAKDAAASADPLDDMEVYETDDPVEEKKEADTFYVEEKEVEEVKQPEEKELLNEIIKKLDDVSMRIGVLEEAGKKAKK